MRAGTAATGTTFGAMWGSMREDSYADADRKNDRANFFVMLSARIQRLGGCARDSRPDSDRAARGSRAGADGGQVAVNAQPAAANIFPSTSDEA